MDFALHFLESGEGYPFIFQHGLGANLHQAQGLLTGLNGIRLISMDCRGHGMSPLEVGHSPSFEHYAEDILRMMDSLNVERAILGGISMGAGISMRMALNYPDRVAALVLVRPAWLDQGSPENLAILLEAAQMMDAQTEKAEFEALPYMLALQESLPKAADSILGIFARDQQEDTAFVLQNMIQDSPFSELNTLNRLTQPCLVIANDKDPLHPYQIADEIARLIPGSQLNRVTSRYEEDATHRQEVRQAVATFINDLF